MLKNGFKLALCILTAIQCHAQFPIPIRRMPIPSSSGQSTSPPASATPSPRSNNASGDSAGATQFDRAMFLSAVKDRLKTESELMEDQSKVRRLWMLDDREEPWQRNIASIPRLPIPGSNGSVSFGVALAYIASQETNVTFASRRGIDALVRLVGVDDNHISIYIDGSFKQFGQGLLTAMFNENTPCSFRGFYRYTPSEVQFANSICKDLKQTVADARREYAETRLLITEKENAKTAIQRTRDLLQRAKGYQNASAVGASISSLETALNTDDLNIIRARAQSLTNANRDLDQFIEVEAAKAGALATAREAGNQELLKTQALLNQAQGYTKTSQIVSVQKPLELALTGEDIDEIRAGTQALVAMNHDVQTYIDQQKATAEKKRQQENQVRIFVAAQQRVGKVIESAKVDITNASKWSSDGLVASDIQSTAKLISELSGKVNTINPNEVMEISRLTDELAAAAVELKKHIGQAKVMASSTGRAVYDGCYTWAKRSKLVSSTQVRIFKDDNTNKLADIAMNPGVPLCRCMAVEIVGNNEITDDAKRQIANDFETKAQEDNQALAVVMGSASMACQSQLMKEMETAGKSVK
jgi:hypothetical protein